jgi:hypothetical protein
LPGTDKTEARSHSFPQPRASLPLFPSSPNRTTERPLEYMACMCIQDFPIQDRRGRNRVPMGFILHTGLNGWLRRASRQGHTGGCGPFESLPGMHPGEVVQGCQAGGSGNVGTKNRQVIMPRWCCAREHCLVDPGVGRMGGGRLRTWRCGRGSLPVLGRRCLGEQRQRPYQQETTNLRHHLHRGLKVGRYQVSDRCRVNNVQQVSSCRRPVLSSVSLFPVPFFCTP